MATRTAQELPRPQLARYEFINSVTSIRSMAELLVDYPALNAIDRERFLVTMQKETDRLLRLMNELKLTPEGIEEQRLRSVPQQLSDMKTNEH